jgi:hypothetical protein
MKTIIAGTRDFSDYKLLCDTMDGLNLDISTVLCGECKGADALGKHWAETHDISVSSYYADWFHQGRSAGPIRNLKMAKDADCLVAFWDGKSKGTKNMIETMKRQNKKVIIVSI